MMPQHCTSAVAPELDQVDLLVLRNLVTIRLGRHVFGLPIESIIRIVEMVAIMPIPQVYHAIQGVINFQGALLPVINLRRHIGLPDVCLQLHTPIILVRTSTREMGLIAEEVTGLVSVLPQQISRPASILPEELGDVPVLQGIVHTDRDIVLVLDVEHLLQPDQANALAKVMADLSHSFPAHTEPASQTTAGEA